MNERPMGLSEAERERYGRTMTRRNVMASERVTRENDTARCSCSTGSRRCLEISPGLSGGYSLTVIEGMRAHPIFLADADLIALAHHVLALAGEPDWEGIARKLGRVATAKYAPHVGDYPYDAYIAAQSAITAAEWAALEGAEDGE